MDSGVSGTLDDGKWYTTIAILTETTLFGFFARMRARVHACKIESWQDGPHYGSGGWMK